MSHFVIIVTGPLDALETALAPYDENERVPEYKDSDGDTTTYNPKSKWDWYQVGGRWGGYFLLKNGQRVDTCRWGDVDTESLGAIIPFAILHDGEWIERGKMGWFASVADEKPAINWFTEASKILASLDPDTIVTAVDCHI